MSATEKHEALNIRAGARDDCDLILAFITELAEYEELANEVTATREDLEETLFGDRPTAEVIIAEWSGAPASEWMPMRLDGAALRKLADKD